MPAKPRTRRAPPPTRAAEWGDFQTPRELARLVCARLAETESPASLLEPTCGQGAFVLAGLEAFGSLEAARGYDIEEPYLEIARSELAGMRPRVKARLEHADFFATDWPAIVRRLAEPILVLGNPPWVTSSAIGATGGANLPEKSNFQKHRGLAARTGASNFDISEWMILRLLEALAGRRATLAMLVKTAVARRVLAHVWRGEASQEIGAELFAIDAPRHFKAAVSASLLVCRFGRESRACEAPCYESLDAREPSASLGYEDGRLLSDAGLYRRYRHLAATSETSAGDETWRSGIKHDAAKVMELTPADGRLWNGLGESVDLEDACLFPLVKGTELARGLLADFRIERRLLVPQRSPAEDPEQLRATAPKAWTYLNRHAELFARRASSIYRGRPAFSIFGVGPYTFAPAKVAIAGFARRLVFHALGEVEGKPVVFDDTCSFLACASLAEARRRVAALHREEAQGFLASQIFWDAKRPITVDVLRRLDLRTIEGISTPLSCSLPLAGRAGEGVEQSSNLARPKRAR